MRLALLCLLLSSCGPVLIGEEPRGHDAGSEPAPDAPNAAGTPGSTAGSDPLVPRGVHTSLAASVRIKPIECGRCFELHAAGSGGQAPYEFEWEDGSRRAQRTVCTDDADLVLSVVAHDSAAATSPPQIVQLQASDVSTCPEPSVAPGPSPSTLLCLQNLSFEGTPAANFGQEQAFDAKPWSDCINPSAQNTPDIGNQSVAETLGWIPDPTDGVTFLALGEGEQVSQTLCAPLPDDEPVYLAIDLARINIGAGLVPETEQVFLEIWGGLSVDCSRHELLWASPALELGWQTYCVTLRPRRFMTQLSLRGNSDLTLASPAYLVADNIRVVDGCP